VRLGRRPVGEEGMVLERAEWVEFMLGGLVGAVK